MKRLSRKFSDEEVGIYIKKLNPDLRYICGYVNFNSTTVICSTKLGLVKISLGSLKRAKGNLVFFNAAINKTNYLNNELKKLDYSIQLIEPYVPHVRLKFETKYGIIKSLRVELLQGNRPTIQSAVDRTEYYRNQLKERHPYLTLISTYVNKRTKVIVKDEYGEMSVNPSELLRNKATSPGILSAVNKTDYYKAKVSEVYPTLGLGKVKYIDSYHRVTLTCPHHGDFKVDPREAVSKSKRRSVSVCPVCCFVQKYVTRIKNFKETCTLYCFKFSYEGEEFYKWGVTIKEDPHTRYGIQTPPGPYVLDLLYFSSFDNPEEAVKQEQLIHNYHKENGFHYIPKHWFGGSKYECSNLSPYTTEAINKNI